MKNQVGLKKINFIKLANVLKSTLLLFIVLYTINYSTCYNDGIVIQLICNQVHT